jgi:hypothetical protein
MKSFLRNLFSLNRSKDRTNRKSRPSTRRPARTALSVEHLEDRLVLSPMDYTAFVQYLNQGAHVGPTHLYLNFDGFGINNVKAYAHWTGAANPSDPRGVVAPNLTQQDIQEILFRTSEIFAPFNVQVSRLYGNGHFWGDQGGGAGETTVFVGDDTLNNVNNVNQAGGYTPADSADYPGEAKGKDHIPNSDSHDVAWVDPVSNSLDGKGNPISGAPWVTQTPALTAAAIAHEAGHTFGLTHVRTDGLSDPANLGAGTVADVMDYATGTTGTNFFANQTFPVTDWNNSPTGLMLDPDGGEHPKYNGGPDGLITVTSQNSFTYLQYVLGPSANDLKSHAVHFSSLDTSVRRGYIPSNDNLPLNTLVDNSLSHDGEYDVYRRTATATETWTVSVTPTSGNLHPVLLVYSQAPQADGQGPITLLSINDPGNASVSAQAGQIYYFVIGSRDGLGTGGYRLNVKQGLFNIDATGTLNVEMANTAWGNDGRPDTIDVTTNGNSLVVTVNGFSSQYNTVLVRSLQIFGSGDADTITLHDPRVPVFVSGGGGADKLIVDDSGASSVPARQTYTLDFYLNRLGGAIYTIKKEIPWIASPLELYTVSYSGINDVTLKAPATTNQFNVNYLPAGLVTIQTTTAGPYAAHNTINVASSALQPGRQLSVQGGTADDNVAIQDNLGGSQVFFITKDLVAFGLQAPSDASVPQGDGVVRFSGLKNLSLTGDQFSRWYQIESWTPNTTLNLTGGSGFNSFYLGDQLDALSSTNPFHAFINIDGGSSGKSVLEMSDSFSSNGGGYSLYSDRVTRTGINGLDLRVNYSRIANLCLYGGGAHDSVFVYSNLPTVALYINTGGGDDDVIFGQLPTLSNVLGAITVDGGAGHNTLWVDDSSYTQVPAFINGYNGYTVTANHIQARQSSISYSNLADVTLSTSSSMANQVTVSSTGAGVQTTIASWNGYAGIMVDLDGVHGPLTVNGGKGTDNLVLNSSSNPNPSAGRTYRVTDHNVTYDGAATVTYSALKSLEVDGTLKDNTFLVDSTAAGTATKLVGGRGNDKYLISPTEHSLDAIRGRLDIVGSKDLYASQSTSTVSIYDDQSTVAHDYTVTPQKPISWVSWVLGEDLIRSGSAPIGISSNGKSTLELYTGLKADTINVQSLESGTTLSLFVDALDAVMIGTTDVLGTVRTVRH